MTSAFHTTRWTLVRHATGHSAEGRAALSELCAGYYEPVVAFLRRSGRGEDDAREVAHAFFAEVLERTALGGAEPGRGRFRSYLLGALKHHLAHARERAARQKRGSGSGGNTGFTGDGTSAVAAQIGSLGGIAFDAKGKQPRAARAAAVVETPFAFTLSLKGTSLVGGKPAPLSFSCTGTLREEIGRAGYTDITTPKPGLNLPMRVNITLGTTTFTGVATTLYKAKQAKSGIAVTLKPN